MTRNRSRGGRDSRPPYSDPASHGNTAMAVALSESFAQQRAAMDAEIQEAEREPAIPKNPLRDLHMQPIDLVINEPTRFGTLLDGCLDQVGPIELITVRGVDMPAAVPCAMIAFRVQLPDGTLATVQAVTTVRNLRSALSLVVSGHAQELR